MVIATWIRNGEIGFGADWTPYWSHDYSMTALLVTRLPDVTATRRSGCTRYVRMARQVNASTGLSGGLRSAPYVVEILYKYDELCSVDATESNGAISLARIDSH